MKLLFALVFIATASTLLAQSPSSIYVNAGATASKYRGDDVVKSDFEYTWHAGIFSDNPIGSNGIRFLTGAQYGNLGDKDLEANYITLHFSLGYEIIDNLSVYVGPAINLFAKTKDQNGFTEKEIKDQLEGTCFGLSGQVSYTMNKWFIYGQYNHAMQTAFKDISSYDPKIFNQNIRIGIGYLIISDNNSN